MLWVSESLPKIPTSHTHMRIKNTNCAISTLPCQDSNLEPENQTLVSYQLLSQGIKETGQPLSRGNTSMRTQKRVSARVNVTLIHEGFRITTLLMLHYSPFPAYLIMRRAEIRRQLHQHLLTRLRFRLRHPIQLRLLLQPEHRESKNLGQSCFR